MRAFLLLNGLLVAAALLEYLFPIQPGIGYGIATAVAFTPFFLYRFVGIIYVVVAALFSYLGVFLVSYMFHTTEVTLTFKAKGDSMVLLSLILGGFFAGFLQHAFTMMLLNIERFPGCFSALLTGFAGLVGGVVLFMVGPDLSLKAGMPSLGPMMALFWQAPVANVLLLQIVKVIKNEKEAPKDASQ